VTAAPARLVPDLLDEYGKTARVELASYTRVRQPFRHLYKLVADYPERGGRMLRPSICLATAGAMCGNRSVAIGPAIAIELLHNAFLVHDDIEDESELRRGVQTLHELHGIPLAVNTGDALCLLALQALSDHRVELGWSLTRLLEADFRRAAFESVEGQAIELGWRRDNAVHLTIQDYLEMTLKKTCWYSTIFPLRAGAMAATRKPLGPSDLVELGFLLGAAFQIQDDLLNLVGDEERYGKERDGDLYEGKRTLIVIHLLQNAGAADRAELVNLLALPREKKTAADVAWIRARMDEHRSIEYARAVAHSLAGAALYECRKTFGHLDSSIDRDFLEQLCAWVLQRS